MTSADFPTAFNAPKTDARRPFWARLFDLMPVERAARKAAAKNVEALSAGLQKMGRNVAKMTAISDRLLPYTTTPNVPTIAPTVVPTAYPLRRPGMRTQWKGAHRVAISTGR